MHVRTARSARTALVTVPLVAAGILAATARLPAAAAEQVVAQGTFGSGSAWTYDTTKVPLGAEAVVRSVENGAGGTVATLHVRGFAPTTDVEVHAHTGSCGASPSTSAGHYMHSPTGGVNDSNELWFVLRTTPSGQGSDSSAVAWQFRDGGARSVTFHDPKAPGKPRIACLPVAF